MGEIVVLTEKDDDYEKNDYVAQKIREAFGVENLVIKIYANEEWSFYEFTCISIKPFLMMKGHCLARNKTREFTIWLNKKGDNQYSATLENSKVLEFQTEKLSQKSEDKLDRFE